MAVSALLGGTAGGRLAGRVNSTVLRWIVVGVGLTVSVIFLSRHFRNRGSEVLFNAKPRNVLILACVFPCVWYVQRCHWSRIE